MRRIISLFAATLILSSIGCSKQLTPTIRRPTQELLEQFPDVPEPTLAPLEIVLVPPRDNPPEGSTYYRLNLGDTAPIAGFLFSDPAAAFFTTEYTASLERYELALNTQREKDYARLIRDTETYRLQINTDRGKFRLLITTYDEELQNLQGIIKDQDSPFHNLWAIVGSGAAGVVVGVIIGLIAAN